MNEYTDDTMYDDYVADERDHISGTDVMPDCPECNDTGRTGWVRPCTACDAFAKLDSPRHVRAAWEHDRARMRNPRRCAACAGVGKLPNATRTDYVVCDVCDGTKVA